jgi:hypothetical protein
VKTLLCKQRTTSKIEHTIYKKHLSLTHSESINQHRLDTIHALRLCEDNEVPEHFSSVAEWRQGMGLYLRARLLVIYESSFTARALYFTQKFLSCVGFIF